MCSTCAHAEYMSKMVQIRNVPDAVHRYAKGACGNRRTVALGLPPRGNAASRRPAGHGRRCWTGFTAGGVATLKTPAAVVIREERDSA